MTPASRERSGSSIRIVSHRDVFDDLGRGESCPVGDCHHSAATVRMSPTDMEAMQIEDGATIELRTDAGTLVARTCADTSCQPGFGYMAVGPTINVLTSYDPDRSHLPNLKVVDVEIRVTGQPATTTTVTPGPSGVIEEINAQAE